MSKKSLLTLINIVIFALFVHANEQPPEAIPGKCYAKSYVSDKYETITEQVLKKVYKLEDVPATFKEVSEQVLVKKEQTIIEKIPAVYDTIVERVLVKEAYTIKETTAATYDWIEEEVLVREGYTGTKVVPAVYETVTEEVEVSPASTKWTSKKATNCYSTNPEDCTIWYIEEIPAQKKTVTRQVLKTPETTREVEIPAEYKVVKREVIKTPEITKEIFVPAEYTNIKKVILQSPATTKEILIPAEYKTITKKVLDEPAKIVEVPLPDEYETITNKVLVKKGGYHVWREVLCESERTIEKLTSIQQALKLKGYNPGFIDGVFGVQTRSALLAFQKDNNLPEGQLDIETLEALGVL